MNYFKLIAFLLFINIHSVYAQKAKDTYVLVTTSNPNAAITVNGKPAGNGSAKVKVLGNSCVKISADIEGFYAKYVEFCNNGMIKLPKAHFIELEKDQAYESSEATDFANVDINIRPKKALNETWKPINSLVLQYIDAIEISDKENMYLRTAWVSQNFNSGIVRTRIIIKTAGAEQFSVKLISEKAPPGSSVKDDEKFVPYDRVLRKYTKIIEEIQNRI
jgi:hypothetical protein